MAVLLACVVLLVGCGGGYTPAAGGALPLPPAADNPPPLATAAPPLAAATPPINDWQVLDTGIEHRTITVQPATNGGWATTITVLRLDPQQVAFHAGYAPTTPATLQTWCEQPGMLAVINAGFFDEQYQPTALVVSDGVPHGTSYYGQGGMFAVDTWGNISLRYLGQQPYDPNEALHTAVQGWPMLVAPGRTPLYALSDTDPRERRSVVAMDQQGRVLLLTVAGAGFTLHELSDWLVASDLAIDSALNLDGGSSTGMCVQTTSYRANVPAYSMLPLVLSVSRRP